MEEFEAGTDIRLPNCDSLRLNHALRPATDEHMSTCRFGSRFPEIRLRGGAHNETRKFRATKTKQVTWLEKYKLNECKSRLSLEFSWKGLGMRPKQFTK
jgi:hypothetical protein